MGTVVDTSQTQSVGTLSGHFQKTFSGHTGRAAVWPAGWMPGWQAGLVGWLAGWPAGWLGSRLAVGLVSWLAGWLGGRPAGRACLPAGREFLGISLKHERWHASAKRQIVSILCHKVFIKKEFA